MTWKVSNSWQAELPAKYNNEDLKDAVFVSIKVKKEDKWLYIDDSDRLHNTQAANSMDFSSTRRSLHYHNPHPTHALAVPRTFNIHITGTFGSFAGWRWGWPTASPPHPVPDAPIILFPACG